MSLIDMHDGIVLQTELDDHCDKLQRSSVKDQRRSSFSCSERCHLSHAKLITCFDDRYAVAKFS